MSREKIWQKDLGYTLLKPIVDWCTRRSYRRIEVRGRENIPSDGAVILAPNHCNTLMDALVVLQAQSGRTVFGARADMFKKPFIAKLMFFIRILPMVRQRDGFRNVLKNYESFDTIVETLENGVPFCIFPEGRHQTKRTLLPLGKGVTRAAVAAYNRLGDSKPVYIVPVGIEYGDYFRYRNTCLVSYGQAINVGEFIKALNVENEAQIMDPLRQKLRRRMSGLITFIEDDENFDAKWALTKILARRKCSCRPSERLKDNKEVILNIEAEMERAPHKMEKVLDRAVSFDNAIHKAGISIKSFGNGSIIGKCIVKGLLAVAGLPYFLFSILACLPMWSVAEHIKKGLRDKAFGNTVNFGIKLGLGAVWFPIVALIFFLAAPWRLALLLTVLAVPSYNYVYDYAGFIRIFVSDCRLARRRDLIKEFNQF